MLLPTKRKILIKMSNKEYIIFIVIISLLGLILLIQLVFLFRNRLAGIRNKNHSKNEKCKKTIEQIDIFINNVATSLAKLSYDKIGGIIIIENKDNLDKYINLGTKVKSDFIPEFITSVFYNHKSPLHDGAIIVRDLKICSLSSYLPLTRRVVSVEYGSRHRAAFGICEYFDCLSFVVSETSGNITFVCKNITRKLSSSPIQLITELTEIFKQYWQYNKFVKKD